jgi:hypothetical protein
VRHLAKVGQLPTKKRGLKVWLFPDDRNLLQSYLIPLFEKNGLKPLVKTTFNSSRKDSEC